VKKLGYSSAWHQQVIESLNLTTISSRLKSISQQQLFWFLRDLAKTSPELAERLLAHLTPAGLIKIIKERPKGAMKALPKIMRISAQQFKKELLAQIDDEVIALLAAQFKDSGIQEIYWLLREFNSDAPELTDRLLAHITPADLAAHFIEKKGTAKHLHQLLGNLKQPFKREIRNSLNEDNILAILQRSELRHITYCIYRSRKFKDGVYEQNARFNVISQH
jgi:hypothetical protein